MIMFCDKFCKEMEDANNQPGTSKDKTIKSRYKVHDCIYHGTVHFVKFFKF